MNAKYFFTIGYEGRYIEDFVSNLKSHNIQRLIDIREIPISRKKGFSKTILKSILEAENIEYIHIRALGSPSDIRHKLKGNLDFEDFSRLYMNHLLQQAESLQKVIRDIDEKTSCFMCFEKAPANCHRSLVAKKILDITGQGYQVHHI
ncbi:MAG: DUF488 domain-containing protein [Acidobacteriota bacterium]|jgi:uncharacterized protein (DUF488 family)|nr:DUF488 domain-containing protein [Acidobacteriota bacterium]OQB56265.1 MAG: hypothetical protein BWX98_01855 [Candidatus Aminicenantes bacterium ADurb.Bin147]HNQ81501.1 DUF488 domain-containing protein [Candidatus Aminicenantes bacterium]MDD8010525.1 DUF488 domain-containing protein [Acidobacteriota bacterium]MDD8034513.1 DUF488 domain-containing protein [Acidobacteriota bacterium]